MQMSTFYAVLLMTSLQEKHSCELSASLVWILYCVMHCIAIIILLCKF